MKIPKFYKNFESELYQVLLAIYLFVVMCVTESLMIDNQLFGVFVVFCESAIILSVLYFYENNNSDK